MGERLYFHLAVFFRPMEADKQTHQYKPDATFEIVERMSSFVFSEKVGMSASIYHQEYEFIFLPIPYQQPIRLDMAFPIAIVLAVENVWAIFFGQTAFLHKNVEDFCQQLLIVPAFKTPLQ